MATCSSFRFSELLILYVKGTLVFVDAPKNVISRSLRLLNLISFRLLVGFPAALCAQDEFDEYKIRFDAGWFYSYPSGSIRAQGDTYPIDNIYACAKILRNIADTYFNDDKLDAMNKTFMVFASYNAGPKGLRAAGGVPRTKVWIRISGLAMSNP